ncbi:MAG: helix-turn-helix domain-containing protein [Clostridia bacterium]
MTPSERLRTVLKQRGMSLRGLARQSNLSRQTVERLASDDPGAWAVVRRSTIAQLETALGVPKGYFTDESEDTSTAWQMAGLDDPIDPQVRVVVAQVMKQLQQEAGLPSAFPGRGGGPSFGAPPDNDPEPLDVRRTLTDPRFRTPDEHQDEDHDERLRCLLEAQRQAYWEWANQPQESQTGADQDERVLAKNRQWRELHDVPELDETAQAAQLVTPADVRVPRDANNLWERVSAKNPARLATWEDLRWLQEPLATTKVQTRQENGELFDQVEDANGVIFWTRCREHDVDSPDPEDHLFLLPAMTTRVRRVGDRPGSGSQASRRSAPTGAPGTAGVHARVR